MEENNGSGSVAASLQKALIGTARGRGATWGDIARVARVSKSTVIRFGQGQAITPEVAARITAAVATLREQLEAAPAAVPPSPTVNGASTCAPAEGTAKDDVQRRDEAATTMGLEDFLLLNQRDITAREKAELRTFHFALERRAAPGPAFWGCILFAIRTIPTDT